jgi:hypothetical protein
MGSAITLQLEIIQPFMQKNLRIFAWENIKDTITWNSSKAADLCAITAPVYIIYI